MPDTNWIVGERSGEATTTSKQVQLPYLEPFEVTDKTPKAQLVTINGWNAMRKCLLENGLMKQK